MTETYRERLLARALDLAAAGYVIFPVSIEKDPESGKKTPEFLPKWRDRSTSDEARIRAWFEGGGAWKGVAIDTGKSGVVVIDLDRSDAKDGFAEWANLPEQPDTPMTVTTQSGGRHLFYRDPSRRVGVAADVPAVGIDVRGYGGCVFTAPTEVLGTGAAYVADGPVVPVAELPELTPAMVDLIAARQESEPRFDRGLHDPFEVTIEEGEAHLRERLERLKSGHGMRSAIFGYAIGRTQYEAGVAAMNEATVDRNALAKMIGEHVLDVVPWPDLDRDDWRWIKDGVVKGLEAPWTIVSDDWITAAPTPPDDTPLDDLLSRKPPRLPGHPSQHHAVVAPVIARGLEGRYLFVEGLGWHEWVGDRWSGEPRVPVRNAVQRMIEKHRAEAKRMLDALDSNDGAAALRDDLDTHGGATGERASELAARASEVDAWREAWQEYRAWWSALANGRDFDLVMKFVEADPGRTFIRADRLDRDAHLLNCPNGTVDLRTGELRPHDPKDYITKTTHVPYDPEATHPLWDKARESFAPGTEEWLQLKVGEGAYGVPSNDDTMLFSFGQGSNGKSTLTDAILRALGDYAVFLHEKAIMGNAADHGTEKMVFRGARWAVLEELPEEHVLRPATIKKLIGTSKITARLMRRDNVTFDASHSLIVNSNHRPQVLENDRGTWRRLIAVPWPYTYKFPGEPIEDEDDRRADPAVKRALASDIDVQKAALAWIVAGAVRFAEVGTCGDLPEAVERETRDWRLASDTFGAFFEAELTADRDSAVPSTELLDTYNEWLSDMGQRPVSDRYVSTRLATLKAARGVRLDRVRRNASSPEVSTRGVLTELPVRFRAWVGLRWLTDAEKVENTA